MGVYIFKSKHIDFIKVGHYKKTNPWCRIAHRGFYSCKSPPVLQNKLCVYDFELIGWFPNLTTIHESQVKQRCYKFRNSTEFYPLLCLDSILKYLESLDTNYCKDCSKEDALATRFRL
jgi:hypothetical protein